MRTLSMICCLILSSVGLYTAFFKSTDINDFITGSILLFIGAIAFLIIVHKGERIKEHKKTWMDK